MYFLIETIKENSKDNYWFILIQIYSNRIIHLTTNVTTNVRRLVRLLTTSLRFCENTAEPSEVEVYEQMIRCDHHSCWYLIKKGPLVSRFERVGPEIVSAKPSGLFMGTTSRSSGTQKVSGNSGRL